MRSRPSHRVSVIITVKNDAAGLKKLLLDLSSQTQPPDEVVISLADSTDDTLQVAQLAAKKTPSIKLIQAGRANRAQGRNVGFAAATGDILVSTDVGCRPENDWLEQLTWPLTTDSTIGVVGGLTLGAPESLWEAAQVPFVLAREPKDGHVPLPATRNFAVTRLAYDQVGPFRDDLHTAEDYEWSRRAEKLGIVRQYQPLARVHWRPRSNPSAYWQMISSLTHGDMLAQTWRWGHVSMVLRYCFFAGIWAVSPLTALIAWSGYGAGKSWRLSRASKTDWIHTWGLQYLTDSAVLFGVTTGLWKSVKLSIFSKTRTRKS